MTCQSGVWKRIIETNTSGYVGIDQATPAAPLHVGGEAIIGSTGLSCSTTTAGALQYSSGNLEYCNGSGWVVIGGSPTFTFNDIGGAPTSTLTYSSTIVVTGFSGSQTISISGSGTPQFSIAGGSFTSTSSSISAGQSLQVRLVSSATGGTATSATITIGSNATTWTVTTATKIVIYADSTWVAGNFGAAGGGGRTGVDSYCNGVKPSALTCNAPIRALVSVNSTTDQISDMPTNYSIPTGIPIYWYNSSTHTSSVQVGSSWTDILDGSIMNGKGPGTGDSSGYQWSGSLSNGTGNGSNNCTGWTTNASGGSYNGTAGVWNATDGGWLDYLDKACDQTAEVMCLCVQN